MAYTQKFYTADTHFGHALMLSATACARPFSDTSEMDEFLIDGWNAAVRPGDIIYHLGDFAFGLGNEARVRSVFRRLNGRKILILGNHDYDRQNRVHPVIGGLGWEDVTQQYETTDEGQRVFLSHYAQRTWPGQHKGAFHFYGHSHGKLAGFGCSRDVGVDCPDVGYAPATFRQLTAGMAIVENVVGEQAMGVSL
jgi:calcineurin-like phosphoesterase family protein